MSTPSSPQQLPASLAQVPFSYFCEALHSLRSARSRGGKNAALRKTTVASDFRGARLAKSRGQAAPADSASREVGSKRDVLTAFWKKVAGKIAMEQIQGGGADIGDALAAADDDDDDAAYRPHTALSVDDTVVLLSMLNPQLDETHPLYQMRERRVAEHYLAALGFPRHQRESAWLLNFSVASYRPDPSTYRSSVARNAALAAQDGVFSSVLTAVLTTRAKAKSNPALTIARVWELLTILCENSETSGSSFRAHGMPKYGADERGDAAAGVNVKNSATGGCAAGKAADPVLAAKKEIARKKDLRIGVFREMVASATAVENAEFSRLIRKEMDTKVSADVLLAWFHPDAKKYYDSLHDLRQLVRDVRTPGFSLINISIKPGTFASVSLAARPTKTNIGILVSRLARGVAGESSWIDDGGKDGFFYMEPKLDGERMQLHKMGNRVETFTRNKKNSTELYGLPLEGVVREAVLAETAILDGEVMLWDKIANKWVGFEDMRTIVTEMRKGIVKSGDQYVMTFCVFDILYISDDCSATKPSQRGDEEMTSSMPQSAEKDSAAVAASSAKRTRRAEKSPNSVIELPLWQRRELLQTRLKAGGATSNYVKGFRTSVAVVDVKLGRSESDLMDHLGEMLELGYEGVVAKSPSCSYGLAIRDPARVIKIKPDYFKDGGLHDIDVIILGAKYGTGSGARKGHVGTLSSYLVGVRTDGSDAGDDRYRSGSPCCKWTPVGNVGTGAGVSDDASVILQRWLAPYWKDLSAGGRDAFPDIWDVWDENGKDASGGSVRRLRQAETMFTGVVKWIEPHDSVVLTIRAYELSRRKGYALRFPRCTAVRQDKPFYNVVCLDELVQMDTEKTPPVICSSGGRDEDEVDGNATEARGKKRRRSEAAEQRAAGMAYLKSKNTRIQQGPGGSRETDPTMKATDVSDISSKDRLSVLSGFCFKVFATRVHEPEIKEGLERQIYLLGGSFNQDTSADAVTHYIAIDSSCSQIQKIRTAAAKSPDGRYGSRSILRSEWLDDSEAHGKAVPIERRHVYFACTSLEKDLLRERDIYGDPWNSPATATSFLACVTEMDSMRLRDELPAVLSSGPHRREVEEAVAKAMRSSGSIFWELVASSAVQGSGQAPLEAVALLFSFFGGTVIENHDDSLEQHVGPQAQMDVTPNSSSCKPITHILVAESATRANCEAVRNSITSPLALDCVFVSYAWVQACVDAKALVTAFVCREC